jgi:hypothetical protein
MNNPKGNGNREKRHQRREIRSKEMEIKSLSDLERDTEGGDVGRKRDN